VKKLPALSTRTIYWIAILLLLPALLINLGLLAFIDDEGIRSLVALEMKLSGNYITPTWHGTYYYNKPPLWNWILLLSFEVFGRFDEWAARIPTVVCLLAYGATIFYFFRKHYSTKIAFLNAFVFITCGRVLFWDSLLALIDICFSWVMFSMMMIIYHELERERYWRLFSISYLLAAIGFLLKGLPSIVFLGLTLLAYFLYRKRFRLLFSLQHIVGFLIFLLLIGGYYLWYDQYNSLAEVFPTLISESSKRTVVRFGIWETLLHILSFPFEMLYHFLPWTVMAIYLIRKDVIRLIRQDSFITFNALVFLVNLLPYWSSPQVYPRYLLMLAPLIFSLYIYLHGFHEAEKSWQYRSIMALFKVVCAVIPLAALAPIFLPSTADLPFLYLRTLVPAASLGLCVWYFYQEPKRRLLWLILVLLLIRIDFDQFVLPDRNANDYGDECRISALEIGKKYADQPFYMYDGTEIQPATTFYLTNARQQIIPRKYAKEELPEGVYIIDPRYYPDSLYQKIEELKVRHGELKYYVIGRLR
jgi:4-amino-4-deoxy-L-arabinose transferase-like glycosyltransferase